ncbi:MAG: NYN domain-containing protein [Candidatus Lindowbacteria bacterium RIFCSPLOWO2_12_FULL_62_27]|nr:MAG: NYN domain-containing protein [Candidatus Lindowbacteria bacterium RIFCSPLOWO2_02_FULL_62_12]OGH59059.1 MAG: NYN domain-containing protein [Candidatus Lindowbacteria bacterium RIFCSPLOWO2_12_FULL_62_27]
MLTEPATKRAVVFIDGQNLYFAAKEAFGFTYPNYDPLKLAQRICLDKSWSLTQTRFYTGIPDETDNPMWRQFWNAKLDHMGRIGVHTFRRTLKYRHEPVRLPDGRETKVRIGREKGIDVRIALDVLRLAIDNVYDVAVLLSQDQDLSEVVDEVRDISRAHGRWIKLASAFPVSDRTRNTRGINKTDWLKIDRELYDSCIDRRDYRKLP